MHKDKYYILYIQILNKKPIRGTFVAVTPGSSGRRGGVNLSSSRRVKTAFISVLFCSQYGIAIFKSGRFCGYLNLSVVAV